MCCRLPVAWLRHNSPGPQSQRWKISGAWAVSLCPLLEQTCPSNRTGLQILVQKWRAQQSLGPQSKVLRQLSPSCPVTRLTRALAWMGKVAQEVLPPGQRQGLEDRRPQRVDTACTSPGARSYAKSKNEMEILALPNRINFFIKLKYLSKKDFQSWEIKYHSSVSVFLNGIYPVTKKDHNL